MLQTKSLRPPIVTLEETEAIIGSGDVIRKANALAEILGERTNSETMPPSIGSELRPTGINLPSAESISAVKLVLTSPGERILQVCAEEAFCPFFGS